jgi:hypothetical protein
MSGTPIRKCGRIDVNAHDDVSVGLKPLFHFFGNFQPFLPSAGHSMSVVKKFLQCRIIFLFDPIGSHHWRRRVGGVVGRNIMEFWVTVSSQVFGLLSAIVLFYAATDPKGKITFANNQNPQIARDANRRKIASRWGLALVGLSFALQIAFTLIHRG